MNILVIDFFKNSWLALIIIIIFLIPTIPYKWFFDVKPGLDIYKDNAKKSLITYTIYLLGSALGEIALTLKFKGIVSIIIFTLLAIDLVYNHNLSNYTIILVTIGLISLYFDRLIDEGEEIKFFGIFYWKKDQNGKKK